MRHTSALCHNVTTAGCHEAHVSPLSPGHRRPPCTFQANRCRGCQTAPLRMTSPHGMAVGLLLAIGVGLYDGTTSYKQLLPGILVWPSADGCRALLWGHCWPLTSRFTCDSELPSKSPQGIQEYAFSDDCTALLGGYYWPSTSRFARDNVLASKHPPRMLEYAF
jgi:hypothetical protein